MKIPFESKLQKITDIEKRNKAFAKMSSLNKRKEIAYEVIKLAVIDKKIKGSNGSYWSNSLEEILDSSYQAKEFQQKLLKAPKCSVCARGAAMFGQIRLGNKVMPYTYAMEGQQEIVEGFNMFGFRNMEAEYEVLGRLEEVTFGHPYRKNTTKKLVNIFCNVISNGDFNTEDKTDYLKLWEISL